MKVSNPFALKPAQEAVAGSIVFMNWRRMERTFALVVTPYGIGRRTSLLLLSPPHPGLGVPAVFDTENLGGAPVGVLTSAIAVIRPDSNNITLSEQYGDPPLGSLVVSKDGRLKVPGEVQGRVGWFDLETGECSDPEVSRSWFPKWEIQVPDVDGRHETVCTIDAAAFQRRDPNE